MRYFINLLKDGNIQYVVSNISPIGREFKEVEPQVFKDKLAELNINYELPEDKTERLEEENLIKTEEITDLDYRLANIELGL